MTISGIEMRLVNNEITEKIEDKIENSESYRLQSRISYLENEIQREKLLINELDLEISQMKPKFIFSSILTGAMVVLFLWLVFNIAPIVFRFFGGPIFALAIFGIIMLNRKNMSRMGCKGIITYIKFKIENRGKEENLVSCTNRREEHINKCKQLELELQFIRSRLE